jgi:adenylate cyclase
MHKAFSLYVPDDVVKNIAYQHDTETISSYGELMQGICMATDADQYTSLSETMNPEKLNVLMNDYYGVIFPQVIEQQGIISDVIGDAMLAIWAKKEITTQTRANACHAALKIKQAVLAFNNSQPILLPTRLGLHFGEIRLGNVGAADHYEYRAIGDTVNTATRIEGLNKILGTRILVSAEVINGLSNFFSREMGFFILKGKTQPVHIYELISETNHQQSSPCTVLASEFSKALTLFQQWQWAEALTTWLNIEKKYPDDKPTIFYIHYLKHNIQLLSDKQDDSQPAMVKIGNNTIHLH